MGPMTGRAAGYCAGYPTPGFMNQTGGRGAAWGRGFGRGLGLGFRGGRGRRGYAGWGTLPPNPPPAYGAPYATASSEQEAEMLRGQVQHLETALDSIRNRIADLESTEDA